MKTELPKVEKPQKKHIGNIKLSESKKAVKLHLFENDKVYVIPNVEIGENKAGKVYEYVDDEPEIVGEIEPPMNGSKLYRLAIKADYYYLKLTHIQLMLKGSSLILPVTEE